MEPFGRTVGLPHRRRDRRIERRAIEGALAPGDLIASREYVSKSDALSRFKQTFGELASTIDGLGDNPLPASIEVRLRP